MKQTELIIFVVIMVINAVFAIWKKYKERQARNAAAALERAVTNNAPSARATTAARATPAMRATPALRNSPANTPGNTPPVMRPAPTNTGATTASTRATTASTRATTSTRATPASTRSGGATSIDARGSMRRAIRDSELQAAAARRRQAEARLFEQQVAAEKARIAAQQRPTPPVIQPVAMQILQAARARSKSAVHHSIAASRITGNSIGAPRVVEPVRAKLLIGDRVGLRRALILREVLGPPRCMAPYGGTQ